MQFQDLGQFSTYEPEEKLHPNAIHFKNENDQDFYDLIATGIAGDAFFLLDESHTVIAAVKAIDELAPNGTVIAVSGLEAEDLLQAHLNETRLVWDGASIEQYVATTAEQWAALRQHRDALLRECDPQALPDYPHATETARQAWLEYRTALRTLSLIHI